MRDIMRVVPRHCTLSPTYLAPSFAVLIQRIYRFIISLSSLHPHFLPLAGSGPLISRIDRAVASARICTYERGLLTKQPCLCHGAVGNALTFSPQDKRREEFLRWSQASVIEKGLKDGWYVRGSDECGLWCGEGGRAWGWLGMMGEEEIGMIGYSDV